MVKLNKTYVKKVVALLLIFSTFLVFSRKIISKIIDEINFSDIFLMQGLIKLFLLSITIYLIRKESFYNLKYLKKNFTFSLLISLAIIALSLYGSTGKIARLNINVSNYEHFCYFFQCLTTGFFEEFFFRVLIFGYICRIFANNNEKKFYYKEVIFTSILFGLIHITSAFKDDFDFYSVISQILLAFTIGLFLQSLFFKLNNIYLNAILHAMINYNGMLNSKLLKIHYPLNEVDISFSDFTQTMIFLALFLVVIGLPFLYFALKGKENKLILNQEINNKL